MSTPSSVDNATNVLVLCQEGSWNCWFLSVVFGQQPTPTPTRTPTPSPTFTPTPIRPTVTPTITPTPWQEADVGDYTMSDCGEPGKCLEIEFLEITCYDLVVRDDLSTYRGQTWSTMPDYVWSEFYFRSGQKGLSLVLTTEQKKVHEEENALGRDYGIVVTCIR
ncbi:hypothetical protein KAZ66_04740 [Candidatus Woesebacteria bacterium]|nr:hypothetical protein [Candidatus Woesebacteria bacterium]